MKHVLPLAAFMIPAILGCTGHNKAPSDDTAPRVEGVVTTVLRAMETEEEAEERKRRAISRERHRAAGERVCEEGEVGTQWREDCNICRCYEPGVRGCTVKRCNPPGPPPTRILRRTPPEPPSNGDESGPKPAAPSSSSR